MPKKRSKKTRAKRLLTPYQKVRGSKMALFIVALAALGVAVIFYIHAGQQSVAWPNFYHKSGTYGAPDASELSTFKGTGFSWMMTSHIDPNTDLGKQLDSNGLTYLDNTLEQLIYGDYRTAYAAYAKLHPETATECNKDPDHCVLTPDEKTALMQKISAWITKNNSDEHIMGYYVLDDYWTDMHDILNQTAQLVAESNKTAPFARPTVCAYGVSVDWETIPDTFDRKLVNYSPQMCGLIAFYAYGHKSNNLASVAAEDWSMSTMLPTLKAKFKKAGWDGKYFIGMPQAFFDPTLADNYSWLNGAQLATQIEAFCKNGATTMFPFAWSKHSATFTTLSQSADLRLGYLNGIAGCEKYWYADQIKSLRKTGDDEINNRVPRLRDLSDRITKSVLPSTAKNSLLVFLKSQTDGLTQLKLQIDKEDETVAVLTADVTNIKTNFIVFNFTIPKMSLMIHTAQDVTIINDTLAKLSDFQKKHPSQLLKVLLLRSQLNSLKNQIQRMQARVYPMTLDQYRANSQIVNDQYVVLNQIEQQIKSIQDQLKALGG